ncbi:MAG: hypothetical protein R3F39_09090 [Myxococcota bacterium]
MRTRIIMCVVALALAACSGVGDTNSADAVETPDAPPLAEVADTDADTGAQGSDVTVDGADADGGVDGVQPGDAVLDEHSDDADTETDADADTDTETDADADADPDAADTDADAPLGDVAADCSAELDGTPCDDADPCTSGDICLAGACSGDPIDCDDGDPCTTDLCTSAGCSHDVIPDCICAIDDDCDPVGPANLCLPDRVCVEGACLPVPDTGVTCPAADHPQCGVTTCNPATGACTLNPINQGGNCPAGACAAKGACVDGVCVPVGQTNCSDDDPCTTDTCDPTLGCTHAPASGAACNDGNACTSDDLCQSGLCAGQPVACTDNNPCTTDGCAPATGCTFTPASGAPCDDGDLCTQTDTCQSGTCVGANPKVCTAPDPCHAAGLCVAGVCGAGAPTDCNDNDPCTTDACNPATGCTHTPASGAPCDDASACTTADTCQSGTCVGTPINCADESPCTADGCAPATGCTHQPVSDLPCNDGNGCTTADTCLAGACVGTPLACDDGDPCTTDACTAPAGTCTHLPASGAPCDDGNGCTAGDTCASGTCVGGGPVVCQPLDDCHVAGVCGGPDQVCSNPTKPNGTPCDDADICTEGERCQSGACTDGTLVICMTCATCPAGKGLAAECTPISDTVCEACQPGVTYSDVDDETFCQPCHVCLAGEYASKPCTPTGNTVCAACHPTCVTCDGGTKTKCTSCGPGRSLKGGACLLIDGQPCTANAECVNTCITGLCAPQAPTEGVCDPGDTADCQAKNVCEGGIDVKLRSKDGAPGDKFAFAVGLSGNTAIVGAPEDDDAGNSSGSAYIFVRHGATWTQQQKLVAPDAVGFDQFGYAVAISGDIAVVGAYLDDDAGSGSGSAHVFVRSGGSWSHQQKLNAVGAAAFDQFGYAVAISGETIVVGAFQDDDAGSSSGSAYVFVRSGTTWTQQQKLTAKDAAASDFFGISLGISGDSIIVGANGDDDGGSLSGSAYVFARSGTTWTEQQKLTAKDAVADDLFGYAVAISGGTAVVGAYGDDDAGSSSGAAYVFVRSGSTWSEQQKLLPIGGAAGDHFGFAVSLSGDTALVGADQDDDFGLGSGSAYAFVREGSTWTEQQRLNASDAAASDWFGAALAVSGDIAVIGAFFDDDAGTDSGTAPCFQRLRTGWTQKPWACVATP